MKPAWLMIAVLASVLAGAGGGYVATQYLTPHDTGNKAPTPVAKSLDDADPDAGAQDPRIDTLTNKLNALSVRLEAAERAGDENAKLKDQIKSLEAKVTELKKAGPVVAANGGNAGAADNVEPVAPSAYETEAFKAAVTKAVEERQQKDREQRMQDMIKSRDKRILDKLDTELSLSDVQKVNIQTALDDMHKKFDEMRQKGDEARKNGTDFDWRAEMKTVNDAAVEAVRNQLSSSQLSTFNTLIGDSGDLNRLGGGWGGGRGFGGGSGGRSRGGNGNGQ